MAESQASISEMLANFTESQLLKFKEVFAAVMARMKRNSADDEQAQVTATAIALGAARNFTPPAAAAALEEELHYFTPSMPQQLSMSVATGEISGHELSFEFAASNIDIASTIAKGNTFNEDHNHGRPVGVIRDVIRPTDAPEEVQASIDPDAPFVFVASYFQDAPKEVKDIDMISHETFTASINGEPQTFTTTFAVSETPLNSKEQGIRRVAGLNEDKPYKDQSTSNATRINMSDHEASIADLEAKVASITEKMTKATKAREAAEETLATFKERLASAVGAEAPEDVTVESVEKEVASLKAGLEETRKVLAEVKAAALDKEAEDFAASLVKDGKIASDATEKFASLYKKLGKEDATELSASLPSKHVGEGGGDAHETLPESDDALASLDEALMAPFKGRGA